MTETNSTKENVNKLIEFRQAVYQSGITARRDALFDLLNALVAQLHFRKATLGWTMPRFQSAEAGDRWTWLTALATWMIFLARPIVEDTPLPWQKPQLRLTPQRVQ